MNIKEFMLKNKECLDQGILKFDNQEFNNKKKASN